MTRRDLGPDAIASGATDVRLNPAAVRADVWEFDEAMHAERWEDAVRLYAGPILNGVHLGDCSELERWVDAERARRDQDHVRALDALACSATRRGDVGEALRWRRRQSAADPFSATIALDTMRALEAAGDRAGAIQHARAYRHLVATSLEIDADPSVAALADVMAARGAEASNAIPADAASVAVVASQPRVEPTPTHRAAEQPPGLTRSDAKRHWRGPAARAGALVVALGILRAIELMPADPTAHQWYALLLAYLGRAREAVVHTGHASRLDPLSVQVNNMHGIMLFYAGDVPAALRQYERTVDAEPDSAWVGRNPWVLTNFSRVAAAAGRTALAVELVERALVVVPSHPRPLFDLAHAYAVAAQPDRARAAFARADSTHVHYAVYRALTHALLGERDEAFAWFDKVTEWPLPSLVTMNCEPRLAALRADTRFATLRARLGMPAH